MVVVNGPIRHQIRMSSGLGALGPFNHANAAIGRAYGLLSRNFHVQNGFDKDKSVVSVFRARLLNSQLLETK